VSERNRTVNRVRDVIVKSFQPVQDRVTEVVAGLGIRDLLDVLGITGTRVAEVSQAIEDAAQKESGLGYATYMRLRLAFLGDAYAGVITDTLQYPVGSYQTGVVMGVLPWYVNPCFGTGSGASARDIASRRRALAALDLGYHELRLRFVLAGLSAWYDPETEPTFRVPPRRDLDRAKARVYRAIADLQTIVRNLTAQASTRELLARIFSSEAIDRAIEAVDAGQSFEGYCKQYASDLDRLRTHL